MSTTNNQPTITAPPTTNEVAAQALATMAALTGQATDFNTGSQIRTWAESVGAQVETQGIWVQALVFQGMVYGAMAMFGITPNIGQSATGTVEFLTSNLPSPPPATQNVTIPTGTIVQTSGGTQFATTSAALLPAGSSSVLVPIQAVSIGAATNVPAQSINTIVTGLTYPLFVTNTAAMTGGADAETLSSALSRLAAKVSSLPASSPVAIANAAIGVSDPTTGETVMYSTLYEPWIAAGSGAGSGTAGWTLYIDNGEGGASSGLIQAVNQVVGYTVSGSSNAASGIVQYRDAGVPYLIDAVEPVWANVSVSGDATSITTISIVSGAISAAVQGYFTLPFGTSAEQGQIAAAIGNATFGLIDSLTVSLYVSGSATPLNAVSGLPYQRVLLNQLSMYLTQGQG